MVSSSYIVEFRPAITIDVSFLLTHGVKHTTDESAA
jgi:hypothetical protein